MNRWPRVAEQAWRGLTPCGVLVTYWSLRNTDPVATVEPWRAQGVHIFCDSGAFSALAAKATIDVNEYAAWLADYATLFDAYANLDVIGDDEASTKNQRVLEDRGLTPLPVFHVGEPWDALDAMADEYPKLALGGMVSFWRGARVGPWIAEAYRVIGGRARVHGFGVTRWNYMRDFPWATLDSTAWKSGARYGSRQAVFLNHRLMHLDRKGLVARARDIEKAYGVSSHQTVAGLQGDNNEVPYRVALRSMALAQESRRRYIEDFTIYCSGV